jgi:hypothetical protein
MWQAEAAILIILKKYIYFILPHVKFSRIYRNSQFLHINARCEYNKAIISRIRSLLECCHV